MTYNASNDTKATGIGDCSGKFRTSSNVHTGKHDRVVYLQQVGDRGPDLLCWAVSTCQVFSGEVENIRGEAMMNRSRCEYGLCDEISLLNFQMNEQIIQGRCKCRGKGRRWRTTCMAYGLCPEQVIDRPNNRGIFGSTFSILKSTHSRSGFGHRDSMTEAGLASFASKSA